MRVRPSRTPIMIALLATLVTAASLGVTRTPPSTAAPADPPATVQSAQIDFIF